ncbi:MAG: ECF transporter S component [Clostridia bacterium]|nr:ECF transporter S component [Clostridia bacterium]
MKLKINTRAVAVSAVCGGLGFVLMLLEFPLPFIIPSFIKLDFSEIPALISAFAFGPLYGILVCAIKNLLHLFVTTSAGVGELSNFILGAIFVGTAGVFYSKLHNRKGALIGSLVGAFIMSLISVFTNYFLVYPAYVVIYGMPMDAIIGMYKALFSAADNLIKALIIFNFPFNLAKGVLQAAVCFAVYKRISPILKNKK